MDDGGLGDEAKVRSRLRTNARRSLHFSVRVTPEERALLVAAAEASSMMVASWIRHHALRTAAGVSSPAGRVTPPAARHSLGKRKQAVAYFRDSEYEAIVEHARACGLTASALIRLLVLGCEPITRRPVVRSAIAAVHRAGTNLLRLIPPAGADAPLTPDQMHAFGELRDEIHALRDALLRADAAGAPDLAG